MNWVAAAIWFSSPSRCYGVSCESRADVGHLGTRFWTVLSFTSEHPVGSNRNVFVCGSQPDLASWACSAELRAPDIAAHGGQAAMPCMAHDLLVRHAVAVGGRHEASPQAMRADRLGKRPLHPNRCGDRTYEFRVRTRKLVIEAGGDAGGGDLLGTDQVSDPWRGHTLAAVGGRRPCVSVAGWIRDGDCSGWEPRTRVWPRRRAGCCDGRRSGPVR